MAVATTAIISAIIMAGSAVAQGVAGNVSGKRAAKSQERLNKASEQFTSETQEINKKRADSNTAFDRQMFNQQKKRDTAVMGMAKEDALDAKKRQEGAIVGSFLEGRRKTPMEEMEKNERNILRLGGGL